MLNKKCMLKAEALTPNGLWSTNRKEKVSKKIKNVTPLNWDKAMMVSHSCIVIKKNRKK